MRFPDIITGVTSGDAAYIKYSTGALFLEGEEEIAHHIALYRSLREAALDAQATTRANSAAIQAPVAGRP